MQVCSIILLLCLVSSSFAATASDKESNIELSNVVKYIESILQQQESEKAPPLPDYFVDELEDNIPTLPVDLQGSPDEDQDESSPKGNEAVKSGEWNAFETPGH